MEDSPRKKIRLSNAADCACADTDKDMYTSGPEPLPVPADFWEVYILWANGSTNSVILRGVGDAYSDQLCQFEDLLQQEFNKDKLQPITPGMMCVAYYEGRFGRVHIESIENGEVNCVFPDHGDTATLLPEHLRPLDPEVNRKLPYQAIQVSLHGLEGIAHTPTAIASLCDLTLGKSCIAVPINWDENDSFMSVVLFDTTGDNVININEEIEIRHKFIMRRSTIGSRGL